MFLSCTTWNAFYVSVTKTCSIKNLAEFLSLWFTERIIVYSVRYIVKWTLWNMKLSSHRTAQWILPLYLLKYAMTNIYEHSATIWWPSEDTTNILLPGEKRSLHSCIQVSTWIRQVDPQLVLQLQVALRRAAGPVVHLLATLSTNKDHLSTVP